MSEESLRRTEWTSGYLLWGIVGGVNGIALGMTVGTVGYWQINSGGAGRGDLSEFYFGFMVVVSYLIVGVLLGLIGTKMHRRYGVAKGMALGAMIGYAVGLVPVFVVNRVAAMRPRGVPDPNELLRYAALGLVCVVIGAIIGGVVSQRRATGTKDKG